MGKNRGKMGKTDPYLVVKSQTFPHFPPSFQHSTYSFHIHCGKQGFSSRFHNSSTTHSQSGGNQNPRIPTRLFRVFHKFPTPYYGYYNKFNKIDRSADNSEEQTHNTAGEQKGAILV